MTQSILGYQKGSPYANNPYLDIFTPDGLIDMSNTPIDLLGIDNRGKKKIMKAGRKNPYKFDGNMVREIPMQLGGIQTPGNAVNITPADDPEEGFLYEADLINYAIGNNVNPMTIKQGRTLAQRGQRALIDEAIIFNTQPGLKNLSHDERVKLFYSTKSSNPEVQQFKGRFNQIYYPVRQEHQTQRFTSTLADSMIPAMQQGGRPPIPVTDPDDPRLKRYQDSFGLYKRGLENKKKIKGPSKEIKFGFTRPDDFPFFEGENDYTEEYEIYKKTGIMPDREFVGEYEGSFPTVYRYGYKKPVQPYYLQKEPQEPTYNPSKVRGTSQVVSAGNVQPYGKPLDVSQQPTEYSFTYPTFQGGNSQKTIYFNSKKELDSFLPNVNMTSSQETGKGKTATGYVNLQQGGRAPIPVTDPNDPRLRSYSDSLNAYNLTKKYRKDVQTTTLTGMLDLQRDIEKRGLDHLEPISFHQEPVPREEGSVIPVPIYKKPVQPYYYTQEPSYNSSQVQGIQPTNSLGSVQGQGYRGLDVSQQATDFSFTYPTFQGGHSQKTVYFPNKEKLDAFLPNVRMTSSTETSKGKTATGYYQRGGYAQSMLDFLFEEDDYPTTASAPSTVEVEEQVQRTQPKQQDPNDIIAMQLATQDQTNSYQRRSGTNKQKLSGYGNNTQKAFQFFQDKGLAPHQAAGIVGNLMQESGNFRDDVIEGKIKGDSGLATGIAQWHPDRFKGLQNWATQRGVNPYTLEAQLEYVFEEGTQRGDIQALQQTKTSKEAAKLFAKRYERPKIIDERRINYAHQLHPYQKGGLFEKYFG